MREIISLNGDWVFAPNNKQNLVKIKRLPKTYEKITLPHSLNTYSSRSGVVTQTKMGYKKAFRIDKKYADKRLFIKVGGAMQSCTYYLNGKIIGEVKGGYTPFCVDITKDARLGKDNILVARISNEDDKSIPPGAPYAKRRVQYFGGLYREVELIVKDKINFSEGGFGKDEFGGAYIYDKSVTRERATIVASYNVENNGKTTKNIIVSGEVRDMKGNICASVSAKVTLGKKNSQSVVLTFDIDRPELWMVNCPYLYTVGVQLKDGEKIKDGLTIRHGIKSVACDHRGFVINDYPLVLRGVNRTQKFPYVGMAVSDNAEYRDAYKIKRGGFNVVRLSDGGNSEAFLDACDELGILVIDCLPSEKYSQKGVFLERVIENIRVMARRDRNHACIAMWEPFISGIDTKFSGASDRFFATCKATLIAEIDKSVKPVIAGDTMGRKDPKALAFDAPYAEEDVLAHEWRLDSLLGRRGLIKEYGDKDFGEEDSTSRVERCEGQEAMLLQAWNYQLAHNSNLSRSAIMGDIVANNVDYACPPLLKDTKNSAGIMDEFRLPKFSYYFFKSQDSRPSQRMIYAATYWNDTRITTVPVYSNCEKVRLYINDNLVAEQSPDSGVADDYRAYLANSKKHESKKKIEKRVDFWAVSDLKTRYVELSKYAKFAMDNMFNGNNAEHLAHPPFTFKDIVYQPGCLKVEGLIGDEVVCLQEINTPTEPKYLDTKVDYSARALATNGKDFVFCYVYEIDERGAIAVDADDEITCEVEGGSVIGKVKICAAGGVSAFIVTANEGASEVKVTVSATGLEGQTTILRIAAVEKVSL